MMQRLLSLTYDPSNQAFYIYVAVLWMFDSSADDPRTSKLHVSAFRTVGEAMEFFTPWGNGDKWARRTVDGDDLWSLDLRIGNPMRAFQVDIKMLLVHQA